MSVGGSVERVSIAGRVFSVASDADGNRDLGGFTNELQMNGDGTGRKIMTRKGWMIDGLGLSIDDAKSDQEFIEDVAARKEFVKMTFTFVSGFTYQGQGTITGDVKKSTQNATAPLGFSGPGKLTQQ